MRDVALPRHRNGSGRDTKWTTDTGAVLSTKNSLSESRHANQWKSFGNDAGTKIGRKRIRLKAGLLMAIAFAALLWSDYALESTHLDVSTTLSKEQAARINATNHLADSSTMNLSASKNINISTAAPSLSPERANQSSVKYQWDGGSPDSYWYKTGLSQSLPVYRTFPDSAQIEKLKGNVVYRLEMVEELLRKRDQEFQRMNSTLELFPCRLDEVNGCLREKNAVDIESSQATGPVMLLYNPLHEVRYWCGKPIFGGGMEVIHEIPKECLSGENSLSLPYVHSPGPPARRNKGEPTEDEMKNSIELLYNQPFSLGYSPSEPVKCPVPCKKSDAMRQNINKIHVPNTNWTILFTMEGERYYPDFHVEPTFYRKNIFYSTTSFKSEIPITYSPGGWKTFDAIPPSVDFDKVIKGASFMARNCKSHNHRESVVKALIETDLRIDSISDCIHNAEAPPGVNPNDKTAVMEQYLFHLAFENQNVDDYITEKLWGTLLSGTLPVYLGAPNIREHVPENSIIVAEDFENPQALADYLIRLSNDKELYQSYHKWRNEPQTWFRDKYEFSKTGADCRMCKFAYARLRGLGWNHTKQTIVEPLIQHKTCRNAKGLIRHPLEESWLSDIRDTKTSIPVSSKDENDTCNLNDENRLIQVDDAVIRRKVYDRDGVTDLFIDVTLGGSKKNNLPDAYTLHIDTPIKNEGKMDQPHIVSDRMLWIQDDASRVYVMVSADGDIELSALDKSGKVEVRIPVASNSSSTTATFIRVRIVTEDIDHFHQDAEKFITNFGDMMMRDFFHPVESYRYA